MPASHLKLNLVLGESFADEVKAVMDDEYEIACRKWQTHPARGKKQKIITNAFKQLKIRVNSVSHEQWDLTTDSIRFNIPGPKQEIQIPSAEADKSPIRIIRARDGWIIDQDRSEESTLLKEFPEVFKAEIFAWARTAVFYAVGSYKN